MCHDENNLQSYRWKIVLILEETDITMAATGENNDPWFRIPKIYSDYVSPDGSKKRNSWHITDANDNRLMEDKKIRKQGV